jgi:glycosyltransferase involved in cell wall biosynthesis
MISILIPAFNESDRIADTIRAARAASVPHDTEINVIDDGSSDNTAAVAEEAGADTVLRTQNGGKGAALNSGLQLATGEILVLLDADLGSTASEYVKLTAPILAGEADMTVATFPARPGRGGGMGLVVRLARWGIQKLTGRQMLSPISGQRALKRSVLLSSGGFASGWGVEIDLTVRALRSGFAVLEVATEMDHRVTGRSLNDIAHRAAQLWAVAVVLMDLRLHPRSALPPPASENPRNG